MYDFIKIFLISMMPCIELRGAIPYATYYNLPIIISFIICIIGNILPISFVFIFAKKILLYLKNKKYIGKFFNYYLKKSEEKSKKLLNNKIKNSMYISLMLFVAIPLPGTGAWTGAIIASILNLDFKKSIFFIFCGILIAGIIMYLTSLGFFNCLKVI